LNQPKEGQNMNTQPALCSSCGAAIINGSRFCSQCGNPIRLKNSAAAFETTATPLPSLAGLKGTDLQTIQEISWQVNIPLLTDRFIMYDLLKVWGFSSLGLLLLMVIISLFDRHWQTLINMLPVVGLVSLIILVLFILVMLVFFGNRFPLEFVLSPDGAMVVSLSRRGRWGNRLAVILGVLAGKPGLAGAGLLGMARETVGVTWDEVRRLNIYPQIRVISLMDSWHVVLRLYCTPQNYDLVLQSVQKWAVQGLKKATAKKRPKGFSPILRLGLKSLLAAVAACLLTAFPLEAPPLLIWLLLAVGLGAIWFLGLSRFFGILSLALASLILLNFLGQGLEVRQMTNPDDFLTFAQSQGIRVDTVPDWIIGRYRRFEHFHARDWLQTGIASLGWSFFVWVGISSLRPHRRGQSGTNAPPGI
jgi:hypothetical protein